MSDSMFQEVGLLGRLKDLLERKPDSHDVVFCVGLEGKVIKGLKVVLKAASSVLEREFEEEWEIALKKGEQILLPDLDGDAFEIFIKVQNLLMLDTWSCETLRNLNLPPDQLLSLLTICKRFGMTTGQRNLEILVNTFIRSIGENFPNEIENLLELSRANLEIVLASDDLEVEELQLYELICRWAEKQCNNLKIAPTNENLRTVLGNCLYELRLPLMSVTDFTTAIEIKNILTTQETLSIYKFLGIKENEKLQVTRDILGFKTTRRTFHLQKSLNRNGISTLCLTNGFSVVEDSPFVCDGSVKYHSFASRQRIALHGLGFLGPIEADAIYDITIVLTKFVHEKCCSHEQRMKQVSAKKGQIFYILFDEPIIIEPGSVQKWENYYNIWYHLKGPETSSVERPEGKIQFVREGNYEFRFQWCSNQLASILFKKP